MVDYSQTTIYCIPVGEENYYGYTTEPLHKCKYGHKQDFERQPNRKIYKAMRDANMTADDIELIWVEDYPCSSKEQARTRKRYFIENFGTLNAELPWKEGTTRQQNRHEYGSKYRVQNRDKINAYNSSYRVENRDKLNVKQRVKQRSYYAENRDEINVKKREWYAQNRDERQAYHREKQRSYRAKKKKQDI